MIYFAFIFLLFSLFEPIIINYIYLSNVSLFNDIILTKKNRDKLKEFYGGIYE